MLMRDVLRDGAAHHPRRVALVDGPAVLTYRDLLDRSARLANALRARGVQAGDRVAALSGNSHRFFEWYFGCAEVGAIGAPLNFRLHPRELATYLETVEPAVLLVDAAFADLAREVLERHPVETVLGLGSGHGFALDYDECIAAAAGNPVDEVVDPDAPAVISATSGTSGAVKGAVLSQRNTYMSCLSFQTGIGYAPTTRRLQSVQLSFATAGPHYAPLFSGAAIHIVNRFEPQRFTAVVDEEAISHTTLPPTMVYDLLDASVDHGRLRTLEVLNVGGAPFDPGRFASAVEVLGPILHVTYGMTETAACATMLRPSDYLERDGSLREDRLLAVGRAWPGVRIRLVDDAGTAVANGQTGEIEISGPTVCLGYWRQPEATVDAFHDGWFRTGDLGVMDGDGVLSVVDRKKDIIVSGGINVSSLEVEAVLGNHPGVRRVAVIGVPDPRWGEAVAAIVVRHPGSRVDQAELVEWCSAELGSFKKPRLVDFVDELPENANGKVLKQELRDRYRGGVGG